MCGLQTQTHLWTHNIMSKNRNGRQTFSQQLIQTIFHFLKKAHWGLIDKYLYQKKHTHIWFYQHYNKIKLKIYITEYKLIFQKGCENKDKKNTFFRVINIQKNQIVDQQDDFIFVSTKSFIKSVCIKYKINIFHWCHNHKKKVSTHL